MIIFVSMHMYVYIYIYYIYLYYIYIYSYWKPIIKVIGCHSHGYPQMPDVPSIFHILHPIHQIFWSHLLIPASTRQCPGSVPPPLPPGRRTRRLGKLVQNWRMKWWNMENGNCCWTSLENCWNQRCWTRFFLMGLNTVAFWKCFRSCLEHHFGLLPLLCLQMKTHHHTNLSPGPGNHPKSSQKKSSKN